MMIVGSGKQLSDAVRYSVSPKPKLSNQDFLKTFQVNTAPPSSVLLDFKKKLNDRIRPLSQRDILASEAAPRDNPSIETEEDPLEFFVRSLEKLAVCTNEVLETVPPLANPSSLLDLAERLKKMYGFLFDEAKTLPPHLNTKRKMIEARCSLQHTKLQEFQRSFVSSQAEAQILQDNLLLDLRALDDRLETILKNDDPGKEFVNLHREYRLLQKQIDSLPDTLVKQSMQSQCQEQCEMLHRESELCLQIQREVAVLDAQMLRVMKASPPSLAEITQIKQKYSSVYDQAKLRVGRSQIEDHCHKRYMLLCDLEGDILPRKDVRWLSDVFRTGSSFQEPSEARCKILSQLIVAAGDKKSSIAIDKKKLLAREEEIEELIETIKMLQIVEKKSPEMQADAIDAVEKMTSKRSVKNAAKILKEVGQTEEGKRLIITKESFLSQSEIQELAEVFAEISAVNSYSSNVKKYLEFRLNNLRMLQALSEMQQQLMQGGLPPRDVAGIKYPKNFLYYDDTDRRGKRTFFEKIDPKRERKVRVTKQEQQSLQDILITKRDPEAELAKYRRSIQFMEDNKNIVGHISQIELRRLRRLCDEVSSLAL